MQDKTNQAVKTNMMGSKARMIESKKELMAKWGLTLSELEAIIAKLFPTRS